MVILKGRITKEQKLQFLDHSQNVDPEYVETYLKCYNLKKEIQCVLNLDRELSLREFDTIMLEITNQTYQNI